jgi:hypothetical protein
MEPITTGFVIGVIGACIDGWVGEPHREKRAENAALEKQKLDLIETKKKLLKDINKEN